jgi:hypothetical protein
MHPFTWRKPAAYNPKDLMYHNHPEARLKQKALAPSLLGLYPLCPPIYDQADEGSCTANAGARGFEFLQLEDIRDNRLLNEAPEMFVQGKYTPVSRNMLYYQERVIEGDPEGDNGAEVQDTINALKTYGVCLESLWPYEDSDMLSAPTAECYAQALNHKLLYAYRINDGDLHHMKVCLSHGYPFIFGFMVYSSFMTNEVANTGIMPVPDVNTETLEGGHAVCAVGYDDSKSAFLVANSWGTSWGDPSFPGYFWFPYSVMGNTDITSEFWTMRHKA